MAATRSNANAVEAKLAITETGMPVITPRIEFGPEKPVGTEIFSDEYLTILDRAAESTCLSF
jgi:hypothetical protein